MADNPLLALLRHHVTGAIERGEATPIVEMRCYCPDDCNCHYPHRFNYCGCKQHAHAADQGRN